MTLRKQVSMVLPESLIRAIKQRAARRGQSVTAYITRLVEQDLAAMGDDDGDHPPTPLAERLEALEQRVARLEGLGV